MPQPTNDTFSRCIDAEEPRLRAITDEHAGAPRAGRTWTRKQELGHLLDSAANNRIRFVNAAIAGSWTDSGYRQDAWVELHAYDALPWNTLVDLWVAHNRLIAHLVEHIPAERLQAVCQIGSLPPMSLAMLIEDYVLHMQHHLDAILDRAEITAYPSAAAARSSSATR